MKRTALCWLVVGLVFLGLSAQGSANTDQQTLEVEVSNPTVEWEGSGWGTITVDGSLEACYVVTGSFTVHSSASYDVQVEASAGEWSGVEMEVENTIINTKSDFDRAFDIAVEDLAAGGMTPFTNQVNSEVTGQECTLGSGEDGVTHLVEVALVLAEDDGSSGIVTAGWDLVQDPEDPQNLRRFRELPSGEYQAEIVVEVSESLDM